MITNHIGVEIGRGRALLLSFTSLYTHNLFFLFACQNFWKDLVPPPPSHNPTPHPPFLICFRRHWTISRMETKQNKAWHFDTYDVLAIWFMIFFKGKWKTVDFAFTDENGLTRKKMHCSYLVFRSLSRLYILLSWTILVVRSFFKYTYSVVVGFLFLRQR